MNYYYYFTCVYVWLSMCTYRGQTGEGEWGDCSGENILASHRSDPEKVRRLHFLLRPCPHVSGCFKMWLFPKSPKQNSHYVTTNGIPQEKASQVVFCKKIQFSPVEKVTSLLRFYVSTVASLCDWAATQPHCLTQQMNHFLFSGFSKRVIDFSQLLTHKKTPNSLF